MPKHPDVSAALAAHGIGLIKLDADNPAESQVLIPARERFLVLALYKLGEVMDTTAGTPPVALVSPVWKRLRH